jgi:hypothetical protein
MSGRDLQGIIPVFPVWASYPALSPGFLLPGRKDRGNSVAIGALQKKAIEMANVQAGGQTAEQLLKSVETYLEVQSAQTVFYGQLLAIAISRLEQQPTTEPAK